MFEPLGHVLQYNHHGLPNEPMPPLQSEKTRLNEQHHYVSPLAKSANLCHPFAIVFTLLSAKFTSRHTSKL
jgi:hypothetical protein